MTDPPDGSPKRLPVLLLEPDPWRFRGIRAALEESGDIEVIGERDFARILTLEEAPEGFDPAVSLVADRLIVEYGVSVIPRLVDVFPSTAVLVHGDHDTMEVSGQVIAAGASGFFDLSGPEDYLREAVTAVGEGRIWAPRETISALAQRFSEPEPAAILVTEPRVLSDDDLLILRYLHEGLSAKGIAARLQTSELVIKARLESLYRNFRANTRAQLIAAATKGGMVV